MAGLDNIPKKEFFTTPEGYFDQLPAKIQSRISGAEKSKGGDLVLRYSVRFALPLMVVMAVVIFYNSGDSDVETILASIETEELIQYLQESDMTTEDVLDNVEFSSEDLEAIENEVYDAGLPEIQKGLVD